MSLWVAMGMIWLLLRQYPAVSLGIEPNTLLFATSEVTSPQNGLNLHAILAMDAPKKKKTTQKRPNRFPVLQRALTLFVGMAVLKLASSSIVLPCSPMAPPMAMALQFIIIVHNSKLLLQKPQLNQTYSLKKKKKLTTQFCPFVVKSFYDSIFEKRN